MKFLKLVRLFVLRNLREEKFLTFLSITGIALGIGLFVGVKVASDRAIASFEADIRGVQPATNYEIFDRSGIEFDERVYRDVRSVADDCFPLIKTSRICSFFRGYDRPERDLYSKSAFCP